MDTGAYDAVIDKGTLDAILCGEGSFGVAAATVGEVYRQLLLLLILTFMILPRIVYGNKFRQRSLEMRWRDAYELGWHDAQEGECLERDCREGAEGL